MKLEQKSESCKTEETKAIKFGIKHEDMGVILDILRDKIYKNPIGSICREIASNARDANREANRPDEPITISIGNGSMFQDNQVISFSDHGPGISEDRVENIFVNYGSSTKRGDNTQTGGFGLGCKTPFAYTDQFAVVTVVDHKKYTYIAGIDKTRCGQLYLFDKVNTKDENGTSIVVPIKSREDRRLFEEEALKSTLFWKTQPIYKNFEQVKYSYEVVQETEEFKLLVSEDKKELINTNCVGILVDGILYELDTNLANIDIPYTSKGFVLLKFSTGELTISANRETLQYDTDTINKIQDRYKSSLKQITKKIQDCISEKPNVALAYLTYQKLVVRNSNNVETSDAAHAFVENYAFKYNGEDVTKAWQSNFGKLDFYNILPFTRGSRPSYRSVGYYGSRIDPERTYYGDVGLSMHRCRTLFKEKQEFTYIHFIDPKRSNYVEELKQLEDFKSCINVKNFSEVPKTIDVVKLRGSKKSETLKIVRFRKIVDSYYNNGQERGLFYSDSQNNLYYDARGEKKVDCTKILYSVVDTLQDSQRISFKGWMKIAEKYSLQFVVTSNEYKHRFSKCTPIEEAEKLIPEVELQQIKDTEYLTSFQDFAQLSFLSQLKFGKQANELVEWSKNLIESTRTIIPDNYKYKMSPKGEEAKKVLEQLESKYPLLTYISSDSKDCITRTQEYIDLKGRLD